MDDLPGPEHSGNDQGFTHAAETANLPSGNSEASDPSQDDTSPEQITGTLTERHPDWPKIKLNVFLGFHATASDMEKMPQVVKGSQIYLYEDTSGNQATETLQNYANRTPEPAHFQADLEQTIDETNNNGESIRGSHWEAIVRSIYGTGVIVGHIDLRPGEETGDATIRNELDALINEPLNFTGSFDDRLTRLNERLHELSRLQRNREFGMLRRLETELETISNNTPL